MPKVAAAQGGWLESAVRALADGGVSRILVALGAAVVPVPSPAATLLVPDWRCGLSATVAAAVGAARAEDAIDALVLHTVDTPGIGAAVTERILAVDSGLVRAVYGGRPGHPVLIGRDYWNRLSRSLSGDIGAGQFVESCTELVRVECSDLASGVDIDEK